MTRTSIFLLAALLGFGACSDKSKGKAEKETAEKAAGKEGEGRSEKSGKLAPLKLSPEAVRSAQLQVTEARRRTLGSALSAPVRITTTQQGLAKIAPRVPGRLVAIKVQLGERVKAGQILGMLESPELGTLRANYMSAATKARVALSNFTREKGLLQKGITSEREMRDAESVYAAAKADLDAADSRLHALGLGEEEIQSLKSDEHFSARFPARAPIDGTIIDITGAVGESVESTAALFTVANLSELWAQLDIVEAQLARIRKGQLVELTIAAAPGRRFQGRIDYIGDVVEEKSRAVHVRVVIPNPDGLLKPGMFAKAEVLTGTAPDGGTADGGAAQPRTAANIVLPRESVQRVGGDDLVFVETIPNQFLPTRVQVGTATADEAEILSGITEGQRVVSQGAFALKSELSKESMGEE